MPTLADLAVRIFADGADLQSIKHLAANPLIRGFTTNPTLMRRAGVQDYRAFARDVLAVVTDRPVSFEVFSDDFVEMERQAREVASWGPNVFVKIPVTNSAGESTGPVVERLSADEIQVNVTALLTTRQVADVARRLSSTTPSFVSVFAGRVADTGRDPVPLMAEAVRILAGRPGAQLIWASPRELLNVFQADAIGCHVITMTGELLAKLPLVGTDLDAYSLETVRMFSQDARAAGFAIATGAAAGL